MRAESLNPCKMNWKINMRTIAKYPISNCVTFCPPWRFKTILKGLHTKWIGLQHLRYNLLIRTGTTPLGCHIRRRQGLVYYQSLNSMGKRLPIITARRATSCCARSQECLSASGNTISPRNYLKKGSTNHPSRTDWEDT